jgi:hypothetical protein
MTGRGPALRNLLVVAALGAATLLPAAVTAQGDPGPDTVNLAGPLGSRAGLPIAEGVLPDAADIPPFDTHGRDPVLQLWSSEAADADTSTGWVSWEVIAVPAADPTADPVSLAAGVAEVPVDRVDLVAPAPGDWLITATTVNADAGPEGTWAWHVVVPDRTIPASIPMPGLVLFGGGDTVVAEPGSSCYLGSCGDVGEKPPAGAVPAVRLGLPDEPIALTLSDGSGVAEVTVTATLLNVDETQPVTLLDAVSTNGATVVHIPPPPGPGRWYLDVLVRFTDGRGDATGYARVIVPEG